MNSSVHIVLVLLAAAGLAHSQSCTEVPEDISSWWRGETNTEDSLGAAHGTVTGSLAYVAGPVGTAFDFDGADSVMHSGEFILHRHGDATLVFWLKSDYAANQAVFWTRPDNSDTNRFNISVLPGNQLAFDYRTPAGPVAFGMNTTMTPNAWVHVAIVRSGNSYTIFKDGVAAESAADPTGTTLLPNPSGWQVSGRSGYRFSGELDELTTFTRALSAAEVAAIHAAGAAGLCLDKPVFLGPSTLPDGMTGAPYSFSLTAGIAPGPHAFALSSGALPTGLTLADDGAITGTPTATGTISFTVEASSPAGPKTTRTFTLRAFSAPPGMVAWWRGQDEPLNALGTHHGAMQNGAAFAAGHVGQSFSFDGIDDHMTASTAALPKGNAARTVECWINTVAENARAPVSYGGYATGNVFYPIVLGGRVSIGWWGGGDVSGTKTVNDGQWHHIAMAYDGAGTTRLYIDGSLDATASGRSYSTTGDTMFIGGAFGADSMFPGKIDEIAVYNRALSAAEVVAIHQAGTFGKNASQPYFTSPAVLPAGAVGTPYAVPFVAGIAPGPVTLALTEGTLPAGMEFLGGTLTGTPVAAASTVLSVTATSSNGQTTTLTLPWEIHGALCPAPTGMVAWWRGQEDTLDTAGANHGALLNGMTYAEGKVGRGFQLDGSDDLMSVSTAGLPIGNAARSLEFWVNTTGTHGMAPCFYGAQSGANAFYAIILGGRMGIGWWGGGDVISSKTVNDGIWHHVVMAYDGSGTTRLYVDGLLEATATGRNYGTSAGTFYIGGAPGHPLFVGKVDEVAVYDRALSAAEAVATHAAGSGGKCGALHLTTLSPLPNAGQTVAYSQALAVTGGTAPFTYSIVNGTLPDGLSLSEMGVLSGTPTGSGTSEFTIRVTDAENRPSERHFFHKVNALPSLGRLTNLSTNEGELWTTANPGTDADAGDTLSYELIDPPAGAAIDANGTISWTPTEAQGPSVVTLTTKVTDNGTPPLSAINSFTVAVDEVNLPPSFGVQSPRTVDELTGLSVNHPATDADAPANGLSYELIDPPDGAAIDANGTITWTPTEAQGPSVVTLTTKVTDNGAPPLSTTHSFTVTVNEVNLPPSLAALSPVAATTGQVVRFTATAADADAPGNTRSFSLVSPPAGATIHATTGAFRWAATTTTTFAVRVTDNGSPPLSDTKSVTVTVTEPPPLELRAFRIAESLCHFEVNGPTGVNYLIEFSPNLSQWSPLVSLEEATTPFTISDPIEIGSLIRYYRATVVP